MSSGETVRRSMTSTEIPSDARVSAAASASWTMRETETTVMSSPGRTTAALPIGSMWSAGGFGPLTRTAAGFR